MCAYLWSPETHAKGIPSSRASIVVTLTAARAPSCPVSRLPIELLFQVFGWVWQKGKRPLKVVYKGPDIKVTLLVDDTLIVCELMEDLAARFDIREADCFSLRKASAPGYEWLDPQLTLGENGVAEGDDVLIDRRVWACGSADFGVHECEPAFRECRESILSGSLIVKDCDAVDLAALLCQVHMGDHNADEHRLGAIDLQDYLPAEYRGVKKIERRVLRAHHKLAGVGLDKLHAMYRYALLCRASTFYGSTSFRITETGGTPRVLCVSPSGVFILDEITKDEIRSHQMVQIRRWSTTSTSFVMELGDHADHDTVLTRESLAISQVLQRYINVLAERRR